MIYVDTSVLVALCTHEARSHDVNAWYRACRDELVTAFWCVTEFSSALGMKQRTGQISQAQANLAGERFERLCANDLHLLPIEPDDYFRAAGLVLDPAQGLRAGDALHLAVALRVGAKSMATLDVRLAENAARMKLKLISI